MKELRNREENEFLNEPGSELQAHMIQLLEKGQEADLKVSINGKPFNLHECILQCIAPSMLKDLKNESNSKMYDLVLLKTISDL